MSKDKVLASESGIGQCIVFDDIDTSQGNSKVSDERTKLLIDRTLSIKTDGCVHSAQLKLRIADSLEKYLRMQKQ